MSCCDRIDDAGEVSFCRRSIRNPQALISIIDSSSVHDVALRIKHDDRRNDPRTHHAGDPLRSVDDRRQRHRILPLKCSNEIRSHVVFREEHDPRNAACLIADRKSREFGGICAGDRAFWPCEKIDGRERSHRKRATIHVDCGKIADGNSRTDRKFIGQLRRRAAQSGEQHGSSENCSECAYQHWRAGYFDLRGDGRMRPRDHKAALALVRRSILPQCLPP